MINYVFSQVQGDIGRSLFADDGAVWKWGRNINHITGKIQETLVFLHILQETLSTSCRKIVICMGI